MSRSVVVVGTGRVAPGITAAFAPAGYDVVVAGRDPARAADCAATAGASVGADIGCGGLMPETFDGAELVVETVVEELAVKQGLLARIEPWLDEGHLSSRTPRAFTSTTWPRACATGRGSPGCTSSTRRT